MSGSRSRWRLPRAEGFTVVGVAHSGAEALRAAERLRPDLVLLDIYLPDMDGINVLRELRAAEERDELRGSVDVLFITAARDAGLVRAALRAGALHYLGSLSRVSARRYLEYFVETGRVEVTLRYGGTGRPERRYRRIG
ncbi:response regulator [Streptomyces lunaelactis]|uniref:response regulator n=1 Tax=Streptomyces lunaelactis TaxID=1535768 RepID=UPI001584B89C|nr:response regulator [Streptomyces lunaelactis]NUL06348.1 response regulator [Streptomyces lunaelactis]